MPDSGTEPLPVDVIRRARAGDRLAFEDIVRRYQRRVRAWAAAHGPPGADADEIAQRTFLAAYTRLAEFAEGTNFEAWLFTIARFQLLTETTRLRRQADYHARFAPDLLARELERRASGPDERTTNLLSHLGGCLERITARDRQTLDWRYRDQIPVDEMAVRSGRSPAAVKKWLWTLRQKLRECIDSKLASEAQA